MHAKITLALLCLTLTATAQDKKPPELQPEHFFLPDCEQLMFLDLKQLREREIWDELQATAIGLALPGLERELGGPIADLDRAFVNSVWRGDGKPPQTLTILQGNQGLGLPESITRNQAWKRDAIGEYPVFVRQRGEDADLVATPRPELRIEGARDLIAPVLEGKPWNGKPGADVQSLLSGRGEHVAYLVVTTTDQTVRQRTFGRLFGEVEWPDDDVPTHLLFRVRITGERDDPHLEIEAVIRHRLGKAGLEASEAAAKKLFEELQTHPRFAALKTLWQSIELRREAQDLVARKDLGRTRQAVGTLALMLAPLVQR
ncbi:MAG: hypothetical protein IPK26_13335 [Planctomycetes bacterium]|nr:hypothetical protein [Planctomycetota bacterium]